MSSFKISKTQKEIIEDIDGSIIVSASAGTGKTGVLVEKIKYELEKNLTEKTVAGITFTIKAANEIKERLNVENEEDVFIGTNNSFAVQEIIAPFMWDIYGKDYRFEFDANYLNKVNTFEEGINCLRENKSVCSYYDNKKNFVFDLALDILEKSSSARKYLKAKYFKLFIDEYQDCDMSMHKFFMYIKDTLQINLFIVGDSKQSIYMWRGAVPGLFNNIIENKDFKVYVLHENYRCTKQIQNLSFLINPSTVQFYEECDDMDSVIILNYNNMNKIKAISSNYDKTLKTAILTRKKVDALKYSEELNDLGNKFLYIPQLPIDDLTSRDSWLYFAAADYFFTKNIYEFFEYVPVEGSNKNELDDKDKEIVKSKLDEFFDLVTNEKLAFEKLKEIADLYGIPCILEHTKLLIDTISDNSNKIAFFNIGRSNQAMTLHSSKGKEFQQVIIFAEDFDDIDLLGEKLNLLYVAITRAKQKLIILTNGLNSKLITFFKQKFGEANVKGNKVLRLKTIRKED